MTDQLIALGCAILGWCFLFIPSSPYAPVSVGALVAVPAFLFAGFASVAGILGLAEEWWRGTTPKAHLLGRLVISILALAIAASPFVITYLRYKAAHPA